MRQSIILVDDDVNGDLRLLRTKQALGSSVRLIDIRNEAQQHHRSVFKVAFKVGWLVTQSLFVSFSHYRKLSRFLHCKTPDLVFSGLRACVRWLVRSVHAGTLLKKLSTLDPPQLVYAHDLYCAVVTLVAPPSSATHLIYDTHELQIHRNRKTGLVRIMIEHALEQRVLRQATEVRVVNKAILDVMAELYEMPATVRIEYNDHYPHHPTSIPPVSNRPTLVYVGRGVRGRLLEFLDRPPTKVGFDVHAYLLGTRLPASISGQYWHHGPENYEAHLLSLAQKTRCMMWCSVDTTCLSYKLATPNKFFQALAMGIPIIASKGSYLAEIAYKHGIGVVFDGGNLQTIAQQVMSPLYDQWVACSETFRTQLRSGEVVI